MSWRHLHRAPPRRPQNFGWYVVVRIGVTASALRMPGPGRLVPRPGFVAFGPESWTRCRRVAAAWEASHGAATASVTERPPPTARIAAIA